MEQTRKTPLWRALLACLASLALAAALVPAAAVGTAGQAWAEGESTESSDSSGDTTDGDSDTSGDTDASGDSSDSTDETATTTPSATYTWSGTASNVVYSADEGTLTVTGDGMLALTANCTVDVVVSSGTVTIDLGGHTLTNYSSHTITVQSGATLTIKDTGSGTVGTVDNVTHAKAALMNYGTVTILAGTFSRSKEASTSDSDNGGNSYYVIANRGTMTIGSSDTDAANDITVKFSDTCTGFYSSLVHNGAEAASATLTIYGGSFTGGVVNVNNNTYGILYIYGGTFKASDDSSATGTSAYYCILNWNTATISGGTFSSSGSVVSNYSSSEGGCAGSLTISGGTLTSTATKSTPLVYNSDSYGGSASVTISDGTLSTSYYAVYNYSTGSGATATITGGKITGTVGVFNYGSSATCTISGGTVTATSYYALYNVSGATATVSGGKLSTSGSTYAVYNTATLTVSDGEISGAAGVYNYGSSASLTISGGSVSASSGYAIYNGGGGATTVKGGTVSSTSKYAIYNYTSSSSTSGSTLTISGGTVSSSGNYAIVSLGAGSVASTLKISDGTISGSTVGVYTGGSAATTTISGGTVTGSIYAVYNANSATTSISGGLYSSDVSSYLTSGTVAVTVAASDGAEYSYVTTASTDSTSVAAVATPTTDSDGAITSVSVTYYTTLAAAINAATSGSTVTLLQNAEESVTVASGASLTLDLNGFTLSSSSGHVIANSGTLTITDSSSEGTGAVTSSGTSGSYAALANYPGATCTINGGTFSGSSWYVIKNLGTLTITDCTLAQNASSTSGIDNGWYGSTGNDLGLSASSCTDPTATLTISGGDFSGGLNTVKNDDYGVLTITGGTFSNTTGPVILNWNVATISGGTFTGNASDYAVIANGSCSSTSDKGTLTITGGTFTASDSGTGALFGICEGAYTGENSTATIIISGGTFTGSLDTAVTNVANTVYTVSISGGEFSEAVDSSLCADGYSPTTAVTVTDEDGNESTYYTVAAGTISFLGGSLRLDSYKTTTTDDDGNESTGGYTYDKADLRFGFNFTVPDGATVKSVGYYYGTTSAPALETAIANGSAGYTSTTSAWREADGGKTYDYDGTVSTGYIANLVFTGLSTKNQDSPIYVKACVTYTVTDDDGSTSEVTVYGDVVARDVLYVAQAAASDATEGTATYIYADGLASNIKKELSITDGCAHSYTDLS